MMSEIPTYPDEIDPNIRIAALETQLAEERAKREAAENLFHRTHGVHHSWVAGYEQERARADKAERELAEERAAQRRVESDDRWIDGSAVIPRIERGMHRK